MNLLIFHLHDMGRYCSPYGFPMPTPHMQAFAEQATLFRNAHCAAPTCSPSRAAMLTGQSAHEAGMLGLLHRGFELKDYSHHLGSYLRNNGYETSYAGVQHEFNPEGKQEGPYARKLLPSSEQGSRDQQAARAAAEYLDGVGEQPFFLWTGTFYPHRPFIESDKTKRNPDQILPPAPLPDTPQTRKDMADYMESVEHADACFGEVMAALERNGLSDKTIVILTTDHGIAFPHMKCNLTTHGTGVALLMDYPGNPMRGKACDALVSHLDLFPTVCELLNLPKPEHLRGHSLVPLLEGGVNEIRKECFAEVSYHATRDLMRSVRTNRYNLIKIFDPDAAVAMPNIDPGPSKDCLMEHGLSNKATRRRTQLFDLQFDPQERHNLADDPAYRSICTEMEQRLKRWMVETDDPLIQGTVEEPKDAVVDSRDKQDPG